LKQVLALILVLLLIASSFSALKFLKVENTYDTKLKISDNRSPSLGCEPSVYWEKTYGGSENEFAFSGQQTSDGGYILAGSTKSFGRGSSDFWLVKTDPSGNMQWNRTYGEEYDDLARSVQQTSDGGYILAGKIQPFYAGEADFWLVKTDSIGNIQWAKRYGGSNHDEAFSVQQTKDEGYVIAGITYSFGAGYADFWLVKTDAYGNMLWNKTYGGRGEDWASYVEQTADGGYILAGDCHPSFPEGYTDILLVKTDCNGNVQWSKTFGGAYDDTANCVRQTDDGGYIVVGTKHYSPTYSDSDFWVIKVDSGGNTQWDKTYGRTGSEEKARFIQQTNDGGYIVAGESYTIGGDRWLVKIDSAGDMLWNITLSRAGPDTDDVVQQTSDGGYVIIGSSYVLSSYDFCLVKLSCHENYILHVQSSPIVQISISYSGDFSGIGITNFNIGPKNSPFTVTLTASLAYQDYTFDHWELDGVNYGNSATLTVKIDNQKRERIVVAIYSKTTASNYIYFFEDFESYQVGKFESTRNWSLYLSGAEPEQQKIVDLVHVSGQKSLHLCAGSGLDPNPVIARGKFGESNNLIGYQIYVMPVTDMPISIDLASDFEEKTDSERWCPYASIHFRNGVIYAASYSSETGLYEDISLQRYETSKWYNITTILDRTTLNFTVWIDNVQRGTGFQEHPNRLKMGPINSIVIMCYSGGEAFYDDIMVFRVQAQGSHGESGDISILGLKSVQVIYSDILIANKPTLVKVDFSNSFNRKITTRLKISYAEQSLTEMVELPSGVTSLFLPSNTWILFKNEGKYEITVNLDPENAVQETNENNNEVKLSVSVKESRPLKILYIPIEVGDDHYSKEQFENFIKESSEFIQDVYPVSSVITYNGWESKQKVTLWVPGITTFIKLLDLKGILYASGVADYIVGVLSRDVEGWTGIHFGLISGACLVVNSAPKIVAHEIGHMFGLGTQGTPSAREEYDLYYFGRPVDGYWVTRRKIMKTYQLEPDKSFNLSFTIPSTAPSDKYVFWNDQIYDIVVDMRKKNNIVFTEKISVNKNVPKGSLATITVYGPTGFAGRRETLFESKLELDSSGIIKFGFCYPTTPTPIEKEYLTIRVDFNTKMDCAAGETISFAGQIQLEGASLLAGSHSLNYYTSKFSDEPFPPIYCFMGNPPDMNWWWICDEDYQQLFNKLVQNPKDPKTVMVSGLIFRNGTVQLLPWYSLDDRVVDLDIGSTGNYSLLMLNDKGETLGVIGFNMSFLESYDVTGFAFTIPYIEGLRKAILKHENIEIAEKVVSYNKPKITLTYPNKGEIFKKGETINIKWNAMDEDGDTLYYSIFYSLDGENFLPLTFNLLNSTYAWTPSEELVEERLFIKVIVSDGVNTNEDVSDYAIRITKTSETINSWLEPKLWTLIGIGITITLVFSIILIKKKRKTFLKQTLT